MIKARGLKYLNKFLLLPIMGIRKEGMLQWHLPKEGNQQMILVLFLLGICGTKPQSQWDKNEAEIPRLCEHPICRWTPGYDKWPHAARRAEVPSDNSQYVIPKLPHSCPKLVPNLFPSDLKFVPRLSSSCRKWHPKVFHVLHKWCPPISYHWGTRLVGYCYQLVCSEKVWISG